MAIISVAFLAVFVFVSGYFIGEVVDWVVDVFGSRGEVADVPELPPCGVRILLTEEQIAASIAEMEAHFPKPQHRRNR